jgi:thiamine-monophosphate kinase
MFDEFEIISSSIRPISNETILCGPGDDCSVINYSKSQFLISTIDCLVENTHFKKNQISMEQLAYKALAVNLSDISAMGGRPLWCHLSLVLPPDFSEFNAKLFLKSFNTYLDENKISLIGGNLASSKSELSIHVHLSGLIDKDHLQLRSQFSQSQYLCVTSSLGDSAAGFHYLNNQAQLKIKKTKEIDFLVNRHFTPPIQTECAVWLAGQNTVHGMMDLSDGLLSDLQHLKNIHKKIQLEDLPLSKELICYCHQQNLDPYKFAIAGGEDYCLLFGCEAGDYLRLKKEYKDKFNFDFYKIGEIKEGSTSTEWIKDKTPIQIDYESYKHF